MLKSAIHVIILTYKYKKANQMLSLHASRGVQRDPPFPVIGFRMLPPGLFTLLPCFLPLAYIFLFIFIEMTPVLVHNTTCTSTISAVTLNWCPP